MNLAGGNTTLPPTLQPVIGHIFSWPFSYNEELEEYIDKQIIRVYAG